LPRRRRTVPIPTPAWDRERGAIGRRVMGRSPKFYGAVLVVAMAVIALGLVAYAFGADYVAGQRRPGSTAVRVADSKSNTEFADYSVEYFTQRLSTWVLESGGAGSAAGQAQVALPAVAQQLVEETIILRFAPDLEIKASEEELNTEIAKKLQLTGPTDPNFETRLQSELTRTGLSEDEYRDTIKATVFRTKLMAKFKKDLPASAESVHYRSIAVATQAEADDIRKKLEKGGDFAKLAKEKSLDTATKDKGGDAGWAPRNYLDTSLEELLFGQAPKKISTFPGQSGVFVLEVLEIKKDRKIDDNKKDVLADNELQDWLAEKRGKVTIVNEMDPSTGDSEKVRYALTRVYPQS